MSLDGGTEKVPGETPAPPRARGPPHLAAVKVQNHGEPTVAALSGRSVRARGRDRLVPAIHRSVHPHLAVLVELVSGLGILKIADIVGRDVPA